MMMANQTEATKTADVGHGAQEPLLKKRTLSLIVMVIVAVIVVVELLFYYSSLELAFFVKPIESSLAPASLNLTTVAYEMSKDRDSMPQTSHHNYLYTQLSPLLYRYEVALDKIEELATLDFVNKEYPSSLELWSMPDLSLVQTNTALRTALSQTHISGEIFLPKLNTPSTLAVLAQNTAPLDKAIICYLKLIGDLNKRLSNSYGLNLDLTEEYVGVSYDYQIGVDKFGKVQYILPLSRIDTQMNSTLIKALWQLPFEAVIDRAPDDIEWGRVKIEFDY